jgi:hypothetical protein
MKRQRIEEERKKRKEDKKRVKDRWMDTKKRNKKIKKSSF